MAMWMTAWLILILENAIDYRNIILYNKLIDCKAFF